MYCSYTEGHFSCKSQRQGVHVQAKVSRQITCEESWLRLLAWELTPIMQHLHHSKLHSSKPSDCLLLCLCVCLLALASMTVCIMVFSTARLLSLTTWQKK